MLVEVIATSVEDAKRAEQGGADRLELISGILEGGITPSWGLIEAVVKAVSIPVNVMVRPHSQSFCYTAEELSVMRQDVRIIRELGAAGVVIGMLTPENRLDQRGMEQLLGESGSLHVTFHRAFDNAVDQMEAARILLEYPQVRTILTSGGKKTAIEGADCIEQLVKLTENTQLAILAGSGLSLANVGDLVKRTGVKEVHFGSAVREEGQALRYVDAERVAAIKQLL
ncbi:copper homeostasis protein CutC [Brevibacillus brevis]|uniref:copper homeostasis protein CutC n=1 Tax=Brevibacillus brevis TaxID=1393 RepID=UPI001F2E07E9|nr:copper homeostasis protein CutC [Brevibacillus brevis]UIO41396.1 copper homeostasis protein CutC [Brevibacillus brevis]WJQ80385.1 copper homeostasis protein CutC [Brevibacillus brevis]